MDFKVHLVTTVKHLRAAGIAAIIIVTPPPIDEAARRVARMHV